MDTETPPPQPEREADPQPEPRAAEPEPPSQAELAPGKGQPRRLSDRDRRLLEFEHQRWRYAGAKEQAIRENFDISATRYYQILNELIDHPEAMELDPVLVKRLRRLRADRQRRRAARRSSPG